MQLIAVCHAHKFHTKSIVNHRQSKTGNTLFMPARAPVCLAACLFLASWLATALTLSLSLSTCLSCEAVTKCSLLCFFNHAVLFKHRSEAEWDRGTCSNELGSAKHMLTFKICCLHPMLYTDLSVDVGVGVSVSARVKRNGCC